MIAPPPFPPLAALSAYAERLCNGARVALLGPHTALAETPLRTLGARLIHAYVPPSQPVGGGDATGARALTLPLDVREGAFDLVMVTDLRAFENPAAVLAEVRRLVGSRGTALISIPSGAKGQGLGYYELFDLASLQFASVRMVGAVPFRGVTLAELGEDDDPPAVSVDTQLGPGSDPSHFVAVASQHGTRFERYAIVELSEPEGGSAPAAVPERGGDAERLLTDLSVAKLSLSVAEAELQGLRASLAEKDAVLARQASWATKESELADKERRVTELEGALASQAERLAAAELRAGDNHVRAERLVNQIRDLEVELERQRDRNFKLTRDVEGEKKAKQKAEVELGMVRGSPEVAGLRSRIAELEDALRAERTRSTELEAANQSRSEVVSRLENEATRADVENRALRESVEASNMLREGLLSVQARLVDLEPTLQKRDARIAELEAELARAQAFVTSLTALEHEHQALSTECHALREALASRPDSPPPAPDTLDAADEVDALEQRLRAMSRSHRELDARARRDREFIVELLFALQVQGEPRPEAPSGDEAPRALAGLEQELSQLREDRQRWDARLAEQQQRHLAEARILRAKLAEAEARGQGHVWKVQELEDRIARIATSPSEPQATAS